MGDYRTTAGEPMPLTRVQRRRRFWLRMTLLALIVVGLAAAGILIKVDRYFMATGYVTTEEYAEVRPPSVGTVGEILVRSGQEVEKGDVLVHLDASEEQATLEEAQSQVNKVEAELTRREAEIGELRRSIREDIEIAKLRLQNASTKLTRTQELLSKGLVAASALEDEKLKEELARAELTSLMSKDQTIYDKELAVLRQELEGRRDAVSRAQARLRAKQIRAPISGTVLRYEFVIGELVRPESVLYEIFGGSKQVLKLRIPERYATRITQGQRYSARLASYRAVFREIFFEGEVEHLRNVIQAEGQKTYRVAYCSFNSGENVVPPGTSAEARVYYGKSSLWLHLFGID